MSSVTSEFISSLQNQYYNWVRKDEKTKEIQCQFEDTDLKIIFNRGRWIYPIPNCPIPAVIENTINIATNDERIKEIVEKSLTKNQNCYHFPNNEFVKFEMRFFASEDSIRKELLEKEKSYAPYQSPRWGFWHECILI